MKLQEQDYGFESLLPENRTPFKIKTSAKLFDILSSGIYKDKILAVIRELSCNAYDAHVVAKKAHVPFSLRLPTNIDPTFSVEDEGTGIDPERITDIYWTYGESSKTNSNDQIGALGLGSKSPFAYTKSSFIVKNRYNNIEYTYLCFINESGMPDGSKVSEESTNKKSGITVEFAVRQEDISAFYDRTDRFFKRWAGTMPTFIGQKQEDVCTVIEKIIEGTNWYLEKIDRSHYSDHAGAIALQGNVPYPIEVGSIPKMPQELMIIAKNPFMITFDMGDINFASSREALQYDERTCNNIISRLEDVRFELSKSFSESVFKKGMTQLEFITGFKSTFRKFTNTISYTSNNSMDTDSWYVDLLLKRRKDDTVTYDDHSYKIAELIEGTISFTDNSHQAFGVYKLDHRNDRSTVMYLKPHSSLEYRAIKDIKGQLINPTWSSAYVVKAGDPMSFEWQDAFVSKRNAQSQFACIIENAELFDASTTHKLPIAHQKLTFFVNDCGRVGEGRYKELVPNFSHQSLFVNFDRKCNTVETVLSQLEKLISKCLKGADIVLISSLPSNNHITQKSKAKQNTISVRQGALLLSKTASAIKVFDEGVYVTARAYDRMLFCESVLKIDDLVAKPIVLYVVKQRGTLYDDIAGDQNSIFTNNKFAVALAATFILSDFVEMYKSADVRVAGRDCIQVLVLSKVQIARLKKCKVNLMSIRQVISDRITALDNAEKFSEAVTYTSAMKNVSIISNMHTFVKDRKTEYNRLTSTSDNVSLFKKTFTEYVKAKSNENNLAEQYAKVRILESVSTEHSLGHELTKNISAQINKKYPLMTLLKVSPFSDPNDVVLMINYIDQMDSLQASNA